MHALLEEISALLDKIKSGTATLGELEAFAAATQQLNERAIILKYKAYEAKVYGTSSDTVNTSSDSDQHEPQSESDTSEKENESVSENSIVAEEISVASVEETETVDELSFDLFSMDDDSENTQEEPYIEPVQEEIVDVIEESVVEENFALDIEEPTAVFTPEVAETPVIETPKTESAPISTTPTNEHPALRKARTNDGSLQSRLLSVRLETLKNAFGLNERILIVKELFGGDNDLYNATIEDLDNLNEVNSARSKVNGLAHQYGWREDSELAIEFIQKVERRYA